MTRIDDELRATLAARAHYVLPSVSLTHGLELRARHLRRRRARVRVVAASVALGTVGFGVPALTKTAGHHPDEDHYAKARIVRTLREAPVEGSELGTARQADGRQPTGAISRIPSKLPSNYLDWAPRGRRPPLALIGYAERSVTQSTSAPSSQLRFAPLWAGQLQNKDWVMVVQSWTTANGSVSPVRVTAFMATPSGGSPHRTSGGTLYFRHAGPSENPAAVVSNMGRVRVFTMSLGGDELLAVGAPDVASIWYASDGVHFKAEPTTDGVAVFRRHARELNGIAVDLIAAHDAAGNTVTPSDSASVRYATEENRTPSQGWGLVDLN